MTSGTASAAIELSAGDNVIEVEVTAQDESTQKYTVTVRNKTKTYALSSTASAAEGSNASLTVTLGENAPTGGLALSVAYNYSGSASSADTGTTPSTVTVAVNTKTATLTIPLASDDLVEGDETFTATLSTAVTGWSAASSGASGTVTIEDDDDDDAKVAFGSSATGTDKYTASVAENVSGGTLNVPVTVSDLPGASTTFAIEVLNTGTATEGTDYSITTKSVTFGPTGSKTKNVVVTITNDSVLEPDEMIELRIRAADDPVTAPEDRYARDANGALATVTITNDEHPPAPTALQVNAGDTKLDLSWTAPTLPSGVSLAGYDVHYTSALVASVAADASVQTGQEPSPGDGWVAASHSGTGATAEITGLDNGTAYRVRVRSRNAAGASAWLAGTGTPASTKTYALSATASAAEGANASLTVTLGENAPTGGLALSIAYNYSGSASSTDTGTTPSTVTVAEDTKTATLTIPLASDDLVEGDETFTATLSTAVTGWSAASSGASGTVTIEDDDDDAAKVAFGSSATGTAKHAVSVDEDVSGGSLNVPVTVSAVPGSSTTFVIEVLNTGTATENTDYSITTKSVTFGPTDTNKTKNVAVTITNDTVLEPDETIELRIRAADDPITAPEDRYARDANGALATVTITNDEHPPAPTGLVVKVGDTKLDLSWTAPTLPSGVSLAGYEVHYTSAPASGNGSVANDAAVQTGQEPSPASGWVDAAHSGTGATAALTGLDNGTAYRLRVRARIAAGASAWLTGTGTPAEADVTGPAAPDFSPVNGASVTDAATDITLTFAEAVKKNAAGGDFSGHADLSAILTLKKTNASGDDIAYTASINAGKTVITLDPSSDLDGGPIYVAVSNGYYDATGNQGTTASAMFTVTPATPTGLKVEEGDTKLGLSWTAPAGTVSGYDVHYTSAPDTGDDAVANDAAVQTDEEPSPASGWVDASHSGTEPEHEITGLTNTTAYRVRVRARNAAGASAWLAGKGTPDELPVVQFTESAWEILEANTDATAVTLTVSVAPEEDITVGIGYASGGATPAGSAGACQAGWDHRWIPSAFTWSAGETELEIPVTSCNDDLPEDERSSESFTLTIEPGDGYTVGEPASAMVAIRDDDSAFSPPGKPVLEAVTSGDDAPTKTTLSFTVSCARQGSGGVTGYTLRAVALDDPTLEREQQFPSEQCGSGGPMTLTGLPLRATATTWVVTATARALRGGNGLPSEPVELATLADAPEANAEPLTAAFEEVPSEHRGQGTFSFLVRFSESLEGGQQPTSRSFEMSHGAVTGLEKVEAALWRVHVRPTTWREVGVALRGGRSCDDPNAVCASGARSLSNSPSAKIGESAWIRVGGDFTREGPDAKVNFRVTLSRAVSHEVRVDYATQDGDGPFAGNLPATAGSDYTATSGTLTFEPGETQKQVDVEVLNDAIDEGGEYFRLMTSNPQGAYLPTRQDANLGLILNSDPLQQAWLARFGRTVGGHVTDAVTGRLEGGLPPGAHATLAGLNVDLSRVEDGTALTDVLTGLGQRLGGQASESDDPLARHGHGAGWEASTDEASSPALSMTGRELLPGSSFRLAGTGDGPGPDLAAWGRVAHGLFDGEQASDTDPGRLGIDGEVITGTLGADVDWGRMLAGVAVSLSEGDGTFGDSGVTTGANGRIESTMATVSPYARFHVSERISAWGLAGWGTGDMTIRFDDGTDPVTTDLTMQLGAAGARGELLKQDDAGGMDLALKADAFLVRTESDRAPNSAATTADASRLRLVLAGGRSFDMGGATLRPSLELGLRHDGGDAETGAGLETGGGVVWADPSSGLSIDARARMLLAHADSDYREWGASAMARLDPGEHGRGLSFSLAPTIGATSSAAERLWGAQDARVLVPGAEFDAARGLQGEMGYGMGLLGDRFTGTPNIGFGMSDGGARDYRIGWRLISTAPDDPGFEVNLDATRREAANDDAPAHGMMLNVLIRW